MVSVGICSLDLLLRGLGVSGRFEVLDGGDAEWLLGLAAVEGRETEVTWAMLGSRCTLG